MDMSQWWMKPHLRRRLEEAQRERERTVVDRPLQADEKGRVTEQKPAEKPATPKNGLELRGNRWREQQERDE